VIFYTGKRTLLFLKVGSKVIRLVAIDVDGTLLDSSSSLPSTVREAMNELDARGVGVVLATARSPKALRVVLRELHFAPWLICFSGAWIGELELRSLTPRQTWWEKRHSASVARWIVETALANNIEPNVYGLETWRVIPLGVNKARSLTTLAQLRAIELSQVAAIGDGLNDLEMLREAGIGIAMGNAAQEVISAADWITATNDEGGVAHAVRKLINEDLI